MTDIYKETENNENNENNENLCEGVPGDESNVSEYILNEDGTFTKCETEKEPVEEPKETKEPEEPEEAAPEVKKELDALKNELASARADFYNYRQRVARDKQKNRQLMTEDMVCELLPVLDNLDRALSTPETANAKDVLTGVRMVQKQFLSVLEGMGVTAIPAEGVAFDPAIHEAVEVESVSEPESDNAVLAELVRGYRTPERVLRAAHVRVGRHEA